MLHKGDEELAAAAAVPAAAAAAAAEHSLSEPRQQQVGSPHLHRCVWFIESLGAKKLPWASS